MVLQYSSLLDVRLRTCGLGSDVEPGDEDIHAAASAAAPELTRRGTFGDLPGSGGHASRRRPSSRSVRQHVRVVAGLLAAMALPGVVVLALQAPDDDGRQPDAVVGGPTVDGPTTPHSERLDTDGDGRDESVRIADGRVEVETADGQEVYEVGGAGDQILVGDWDCDGVATPLLYRPDRGLVHRYDAWPTVGDPQRPVTEDAAVGGTAHRRDTGRCDVLVVR